VSWTVEIVTGGSIDGGPEYGVFWTGSLFRGGFSSEGEARAKLEELRRRYRGSSPGLMLRASISKTKRGGPYSYALPKGKEWSIPSTGTIPANSVREAREILATWLQRKRCPAGTSVTRKEE
jgi:hypothetical protein